MRVVVLGGGIAGLAAAYRLERLRDDAEVVLVERTDRLGGKIETERIGAFVVEHAPDSFLSRKERGVGLCAELGLAGDLVGRRAEFERTFVRRGSDLLPLPAGLTGTIPTDLDELEGSALLTQAGRERLAREPEVPLAGDPGDESIASFFTRRLGREAYESLVEPLTSGIYGGDDLLSLEATFPQLRTLEREHGSLIHGLAARRPASSGLPAFVSLRTGMEMLVSALAARLERARIVTGLEARRVEDFGRGYRVALADGSLVEADGLVVALPAFAAADVLETLDDELAALHAEIPYGSSAIVTLAFRARDVERPVDGYGYLVPRVEGSDVLACTWTSRKWPDRAPEDTHLVRLYAGRFGGRDPTTEPDAGIVALALDELSSVGVDGQPLLTRVRRWPRGMPQYVLGHPERLERIDELLGRHPGLALAGAAYRGVGIPDCIRSGEDAAEAVVRALAPVHA